MNKEDDFLLDVLSRVRAAGVALTDEVALALERDIRRDYGGDFPYISKTVKQVDKKALAMADLKDNVPMSEVSKKHGISRSSLYRLLRKP